MATVETATEIRPFQVDISEEALDDLRRRTEAPLLTIRRRIEHRASVSGTLKRGDERV